MKWEEVRRLYPNRFVKLKVLEWHMDGNQKHIEDMAVIKAFENNKEATRELVRAQGDTLIYHTGNENIVVEVRDIKGYRRMV